MREVGGGDNDAPGARAIGRTRNIMRGIAGLRSWNSFHGDRGLGEYCKEFGKPGLHLRDVAGKIVDDLIGRLRDVFGICGDRNAIGLQVAITLLKSESVHRLSNASDLFKAKGANIRW